MKLAAGEKQYVRSTFVRSSAIMSRVEYRLHSQTHHHESTNPFSALDLDRAPDQALDQGLGRGLGLALDLPPAPAKLTLVAHLANERIFPTQNSTEITSTHSPRLSVTEVPSPELKPVQLVSVGSTNSVVHLMSSSTPNNSTTVNASKTIYASKSKAYVSIFYGISTVLLFLSLLSLAEIFRNYSRRNRATYVPY
jgi:hypothetical protein